MSCYIRPNAIPSHPSHQNFTQFNPLLSFLEDFATQFAPENSTTTPAHRQQQQRSASSSASASAKKTEKPTPSYTPRFDVVEKDTAYELYGELPGVKVEDISVEFSDEKTLVIAGSSSRFFNDTATNTVVTETTPSATTSDTEASAKGKQKQAAVEDADDDFEDLSSTATTPSSATVPDPEFQSPEELDTATPQHQQDKTSATEPEPEHKFLLSERKYGSFERKFQFQLPVEKEEVSARLRDGVLVVKVPKRVVRAQKVWVSVD